jgi:hypothetical protein
MAKAYLIWDDSTALEGIHHYRVYQDDKLVSNPYIRTYTVDDLEFDIEYSFYIVAVTNDDRISKKSETVSVTLVEGQNNFNYNFNFYI